MDSLEKTLTVPLETKGHTVFEIISNRLDIIKDNFRMGNGGSFNFQPLSLPDEDWLRQFEMIGTTLADLLQEKWVIYSSNPAIPVASNPEYIKATYDKSPVVLLLAGGKIVTGWLIDGEYHDIQGNVTFNESEIILINYDLDRIRWRDALKKNNYTDDIDLVTTKIRERKANARKKQLAKVYQKERLKNKQTLVKRSKAKKARIARKKSR